MITIQQEINSLPRGVFDSVVHREKQPLSRPYITVRALAALAILNALTFVLVACSGSGADALRGTAWELASLLGSGLIPGTSITIEFSNDEVSGLAGCNHYWGSYQVSGSSLSMSDVFWTEMGCLEPEGILEQERVYLAALNVADSYQLTGDQLEIFDEVGERVLVFVTSAGGSTSQAEEPPEQPDELETFVTQDAVPTANPEPTPTAEVVEEIPSPAADPPPGFKLYKDAKAVVSLFLPENWTVTQVLPGQSAVLQSYPETKYIGGEALQAGDTKCDLSIRPPDIMMVDFVQEMKANTAITILSEAEIVLESGQPGIRLEVESMGRSSTLITEVNEQIVVLNCFGELEQFLEFAVTLREVD